MNNNELQKDKIKNILEKIKKNELSLRPKTYFRLKFVALMIIICAVSIVSIFLASFIVFTFRVSGHASLVGFGLTGWQLFILLFPWKLFFLEIVLILLLEWFLRSFRFGYKAPIIYLLIGILGLMAITGFIVDTTPLHMRLLDQADRHNLPSPFRDMYESTRRPPPLGHGIFKGTIENINENTITVDLDNPIGIGTTTPIVVDVGTIPQKDEIQLGNRVFIIGEIINGHIHAYNIHLAHDIRPPHYSDQVAE